MRFRLRLNCFSLQENCEVGKVKGGFSCLDGSEKRRLMLNVNVDGFWLLVVESSKRLKCGMSIIDLRI